MKPRRASSRSWVSSRGKRRSTDRFASATAEWAGLLSVGWAISLSPVGPRRGLPGGRVHSCRERETVREGVRRTGVAVPAPRPPLRHHLTAALDPVAPAQAGGPFTCRRLTHLPAARPPAEGPFTRSGRGPC